EWCLVSGRLREFAIAGIFILASIRRAHVLSDANSRSAVRHEALFLESAVSKLTISNVIRLFEETIALRSSTRMFDLCMFNSSSRLPCTDNPHRCHAESRSQYLRPDRSSRSRHRSHQHFGYRQAVHRTGHEASALCRLANCQLPAEHGIVC